MTKKYLKEVKDFNKLEMWEVTGINKDLRVRRIPGGFIYEYLEGEKVTACCFISTEELRNE